MHLLLPFPVLGAAEDYGLTLASGMARRGWEVTVAHSQGVDVVLDHPLVRTMALDTNSLAGLARWLAKEKPALLHVNQAFLPALAIARIERIHPTVVTAHTPALAARLSLRGRTLQFVARGGVDRWIVLSERNRRLMAESRGVRNLISVVHPGLPAERFLDLPNEADARASIGASADAIVIGTIGRLSKQKRHDILIEAVALASREVQGLQLIIVGDGELARTTRTLADERLPGQVILTGHRSDAIRLLPAFDIFALSSDFEGLPFALLEAMATSRAIVTTDVQGTGEAVRNQQEGLLVPRRDPEALAVAIVTLARDKNLAERLARAARDRFLDEFTADLMVDQIEALYLELLKSQKEGQ
jgi:glycosyltransferase involved in cell wall biosynthesis